MYRIPFSVTEVEIINYRTSLSDIFCGDVNPPLGSDVMLHGDAASYETIGNIPAPVSLSSLCFHGEGGGGVCPFSGRRNPS